MAIFFNEDPNHFIWCRADAGIDVGPKEIDDFIYQYKGSGITDFFVCVTASTAWYPCKSRDNAIDCYKRAMADGKVCNEGSRRNNYVGLLYDIYERQGIKLHEVWMQRLREIGINPWISLRANDVHCNDDEGNYLNSSFFRNNKDKRRCEHHSAGATEYFDNALDFCHPEVRKHLLDLVEEVLNDFDMYGLEIDWMREIYSLHIGKEYEGTKYLTEFMEQVKQLVLASEKRVGHPIKIGIRLPGNPVSAIRLGFDFVDWVDRGLVDLIVVSPRWATSDNNMAFDIYKKMLRGSDVALAAGLEILIDGTYDEPHKHIMMNSPETARATAAAYLSMGADAVYLFNYMDVPDGVWEDNRSMDILRGETYRELLSDLGDFDKVKNKPRRHVVTYDDVRVPGVPHRNPLPLECGYRRSGNPAFLGKPKYKTLRIPTGEVPTGAPLRFVLGIDKFACIDACEIEVCVNGRPSVCGSSVTLPKPCRDDLVYFGFEIPNDGSFPPVSIVEIATKKRPFTVLWAEIDVGLLEK